MAAAFFGGLPRLSAGPCRASIARFRRSRSTTSAATISGMGISGDGSTANRRSGAIYRAIESVCLLPALIFEAGSLGYKHSRSLTTLGHSYLMSRRVLCYGMSEDNADQDRDCDQYTYRQRVGKDRIIHYGLPPVGVSVSQRSPRGPMPVRVIREIRRGLH